MTATVEVRAALDRAAFALFRIKRMPPEAIPAFASAEHEAACQVLDADAGAAGVSKQAAKDLENVINMLDGLNAFEAAAIVRKALNAGGQESAGKWCSWCKVDSHNDAECHSTRTVAAPNQSDEGLVELVAWLFRGKAGTPMDGEVICRGEHEYGKEENPYWEKTEPLYSAAAIESLQRQVAELTRQLEGARADERELCGKECDRFLDSLRGRTDDRGDGAFVAITRLANSIRAHRSAES